MLVPGVSIRDKFRGYYGLDESETDELWESALLVVDTNVLLGLYGQTPKTRQTMMNILEGEKDRLWIPHQVGLEFQRNREKAQREATNSHRDLDGLIRSHRAKVKSAIEELKKYNVSLDVGVRLRAYERQAGALAQAITQAKKDFAQDLSQGDSVLATVESLYPSERIGDPFSPKALSKHRRMGAERFAALVPPGYADAKTKTGDRIFGDYFLWAQLIRHARRTRRDVIWVTNDQKDDWVDPTTGMFYPALTDEFVAETGQLILLYKSSEFVEEAKRRLSSIQESDEEIVEAAKEIDRQGKSDLASWWLRDANIAPISDALVRSLPQFELAGLLGNNVNDRLGLTQLVAGLAEQSRGILTPGISEFLSATAAESVRAMSTTLGGSALSSLAQDAVGATTLAGLSAALGNAGLSYPEMGTAALAAVELAREQHRRDEAQFGSGAELNTEPTEVDLDNREDDDDDDEYD